MLLFQDTDSTQASRAFRDNQPDDEFLFHTASPRTFDEFQGIFPAIPGVKWLLIKTAQVI